MEYSNIFHISGRAMHAQGTRLRIVAENLANANSAAPTPEEDPYRRQTVTFRNMLDRERGVETVEVARVGKDWGEFKVEHNPGHPGADEDGYVRLPNVNSLIEMMDMKEAQRSYEANVAVIDLAKTMALRTIDILSAR